MIIDGDDDLIIMDDEIVDITESGALPSRKRKISDTDGYSPAKRLRPVCNTEDDNEVVVL